MESLTKNQIFSKRDSRQRKQNISPSTHDFDDMSYESCLTCEKKHRTIFHAISHGCMPCVVFFVEKDGNEKINSNVWRKKSPHYPLEKACQEGHFEIAEFLISSGAQLKKKSNHIKQLLENSLQHCNIVQLLIRRCVEIKLSIDINDLLYKAIEYEYENTACFLINEYKNDGKALLEAQRKRSSPLIVIAAQYGLKNVISLLCKKFQRRLDLVDEPNDSGLTALYYALKRGDHVMSARLIEAGAKFAHISKAIEIGYNPKLAQLIDSAFLK
jgi:ankyrin repeat protein